MRKKFLALLLCLVVAFTMVGCGSSSAKIASTYAYSAISDFVYGGTVMGTNTDAYVLTLYSDNSYEMTMTQVTNMSGTDAGTTSIASFGTYKKGASADGYLSIELTAASRLVYNSFSTLGGYAFDYDTDTTTEFIIPGGDDVAIDKAAFMTQLGYNESRTVYIALDTENKETCHMEFTAQ